MNVEKFVKALDYTEQVEVGLRLPDDVMQEVARRRYGEAFGALATAPETQGADLLGHAEQETEFKQSVERFLNSRHNLPADEQLTVMSQYWDQLGYQMPALSDQLMDNLRHNLDEPPSRHGRRVIPYPFLTLTQYVDVVAKAHTFSSHQLRPHLALAYSDLTFVHGRLIRQPELPVDKGTHKYFLLYRTADRGLLNRTDFMSTMIDTGLAVPDQSGATWFFPIMNVDTQLAYSSLPPGAMSRKIDASDTPGALITTQLLHHVIGKPLPSARVDFSNEIIFVEQTGQDRGQADMVTGVSWDEDDQAIHLHGYDANKHIPLSGHRSISNGLAPIIDDTIRSDRDQ